MSRWISTGGVKSHVIVNRAVMLLLVLHSWPEASQFNPTTTKRQSDSAPDDVTGPRRLKVHRN